MMDPTRELFRPAGGAGLSPPGEMGIEIGGTPVAGPEGTPQLIGQSPAMRQVVATIERVAPTDTAVLIQGEAGTGKGLVAQAIHALSHRCQRPMVAVNCAALPATHIASELFGSADGQAHRLGRFERAQGGTLFVKEIGDMPLPLQVRLLRVLQQGVFDRLGGHQAVAADVRLITATQRDLEPMVSSGSFREDLYYRLSVVPVQVPPLRDRTEDVWPLVQYYLAEFQRQMNKQGICLSDRTRMTLEGHPWPGNARELANVVERIVALAEPHAQVSLENIPGRSSRAPTTSSTALGEDLPQGGLREALGQYEKRLITEALRVTRGNQSKAARRLGVSRQALALKMRKYDVRASRPDLETSEEGPREL